MKKFFLTSILCACTIVNAMAQASHSVYKFTDTANGNLYTNETGSEQAVVNEGDVCSQNYFVAGFQYNVTSNPATTLDKVFKVKNYFVNVDDVYSNTYNQAYNQHSVYATAAETLLDFSSSTNPDYTTYLDVAEKLVFTSVTNNGAQIYITDASSVSDIAVDQTNPSLAMTAVKIGDVFDDSKIYVYSYSSGYVNGIQYNGSRETWTDAQWYTKSETIVSFKDAEVGNVYYKNGEGIFTAITSTDYSSGTEYYTLNFTIVTDNAATFETPEAIATNFNTTEIVNLGGAELYWNNAGNYEQVVDGSVYLGDGKYYTKQNTYVSKTPAELEALGYVNAETKYYNCDVVKDGNTVTITYHDYAYRSLFDYINECPEDISGFANVVIKSTDASHSSVENVNNIIAGINNVTGVTNLVLEELPNYGLQDYNFATLTNPSLKRIILPTVGANMVDYSDISSKISKISATNTNVVLEVVAYYGTEYHCLIQTPKAGSLAEIGDAHYYSSNIDRSTRQVYFGEIDHTDIGWFDGVNVSELDLSQLGHDHANDGKLAELKAALHKLDNDVVEYIALPDLKTKPVDGLYTDLRNKCSNVIAVGQYTSDDKTLTVYTKTPGHVKYVTDMLGDLTDKNSYTKLVNGKISGKLNAMDIFAPTTNNGKIGSDGHLYFSDNDVVDEYATTNPRTVVAGAAGTLTSEGALTGLQNGFTNLDLSDAIFERYQDATIAVTNAAGTNTQSVVLPTDPNFKDIPADFLNITCTVSEICIPSNIENIHARAFSGAPINYVWTTGSDANISYDNGQYYEKDGQFVVVKRGEDVPADATWNSGTITLSSNLKFVGSYAFSNTTLVKDIYVLATTAPECCVDAFSSKTCVANNTLPKINGEVTRESYAHLSDHYYMAVLHFPASVDDTNAKRYTDVTKEFSIALGDRDDKGKLIMYPMQTEMNKAYVDATTGYLWNYSAIERELNEGFATFYEVKDGLLYATGASQSQYQSAANAKYAEAKNPSQTFYAGTNAASYNETIYDKDYRGWHQIILTAYANNGTTPTNSHDFSNINDNEWWTICVPFDMTKAELLKVFGTSGDQLASRIPAYPRVCEFMGVTRKYGKSITLNFGLDLVQNKGGVKDAPVADDDVVLVAGHPYMIQPALPDNPSPASRVLTYAEGDKGFAKLLDKTDSQLKVLAKNNIVTRTKSAGEVTTDNVTKDVHCPDSYTFVGSFWKYSMPQYSYFLGWNSNLNGGKGGVCYFYQTGAENLAVRSWNPGTAIIVANWKEGTTFNTVEKLETTHWVFTADANFFTDDSFESMTSPVGAKTAAHSLMAFDIEIDGEAVTGVNTIHNGPNTVTSISGNVYDLNGRIVREAGNKTPLVKGIYVVEGKKYVVK